jgi:putative methionine-R-sulfoxide reductase with GAF domain
VSAHNGGLQAIDEIVSRGGEADEVLREVVAVLHRDYSWVGISFVEAGELVLGPTQGERTAEPTAIPIPYENNVVAQLGVVAPDLSAVERAHHERVAELLAPYCLVGWDTGGEAWTP